jgi:hypothetical protein
MGLVKMIRDVPEVAGGKTEAMIPEDSVKQAKDAGWKIAEDTLKAKPLEEEVPVKKEEVSEVKKVEEPKKEEQPKAEPKLSAKK